MINKPTFATMLVMVTLISYAQTNYKFGKVSEEELQLTECAFEPEANSMVLSHTGDLWFEYNDVKNSWQYRLEIVKRIKVFNKLDKDIANISISIYDPENSSDKELIMNLKAFTYNLEDGKVNKTKLSNSEEYKTRISEYRSDITFALPEVKEGSVIEYKYTLISDFISNLYSWHFQDDIPVAYSQFTTKIPQFFNYTPSQVGTYVPLEIDESGISESFTYSYKTEQVNGSNQRKTGSIESSSKLTTYVVENVPSMQDEPYMSNKPDVPTRLEFQLMSIQMPGQALKPIAGNYDQFNETIMDWGSFGVVLKKGNFSKDLIANMNVTGDSLAIALYHHVKDHFTHNGSYGFTSSDAGRKAYNDGTGSVAAINLTLLAILREAGFTANPVILSTRGHGLPHPIYPNYEEFNYVIAAVELSTGTILLDASAKSAFGILPQRCLNGNGWMASEDGGQWINLKQQAQHETTTMITINLNEEDIQSAHVVKYSGYAAEQEKGGYDSEDESKYIESLAANFVDAEINDLSFDSESADVKVSFTVNKPGDLEDIIYLQPLQMGIIKSNPFKRETRQSIVDFAYPLSKSVIVRITIPEGYTAELPEPSIVALPNKGGRFTYNASQMGNTISLVSKFDLNQTMFSPDEYASLKQFYDLVVKKNTEMIVLKAI
ncbi:DUF3857 domain-containing protein [Marinoscillum sp.]|uniref:DUF3857 domain-containing protein n=1 Tax=Marinoscillum sp. TaxID=2024838 RepID=UPI003BAC042C